MDAHNNFEGSQSRPPRFAGHATSGRATRPLLNANFGDTMKSGFAHLLLLCATLLGLGGIAFADPSPQVQQQIDHLIAYVRDSKLTFLRNGAESGSDAAAQHIEEKYKHFKSEIVTARDFIDKAASRSMLSGKPYLVKFPDGSTKEVSEWLRAEVEKKAE